MFSNIASSPLYIQVKIWRAGRGWGRGHNNVYMYWWSDTHPSLVCNTNTSNTCSPVSWCYAMLTLKRESSMRTIWTPYSCIVDHLPISGWLRSSGIYGAGRFITPSRAHTTSGQLLPYIATGERDGCQSMISESVIDWVLLNDLSVVHTVSARSKRQE